MDFSPEMIQMFQLVNNIFKATITTTFNKVKENMLVGKKLKIFQWRKSCRCIKKSNKTSR